jgi:phosphoglycerate kinase
MTHLLRVNLDIAGPRIRKNPRFRAAVASIKSLASLENKIVVFSHRGRPSPEKREPELSLKPLAALIQRELKHKVVFLDHFDFPTIRQTVKEAPGGSIFLLENMRYLSGETKNDPELGRQLASLGDHFINDDFASSHRANASLEAITEFISHSPGVQLERELSWLKSITRSEQRPFIIIVGGVKLEEKLGILERFLPDVDTILLGGVPANTVAKARGISVQNSLCDDQWISRLSEVIRNEKVIVPKDFRGERRVVYDIGPKTIKEYISFIKGAKKIIWSGPMGLIEKRRFSRGTRAVAKAIFDNHQAQAVIGGGDTLSAISPRLMESNSGVLVSTGGGAMLAFLAGETLPGLEALDKNT